ncbi:MAG: hypothetical protein IJJ41_05240 [Clostridia bacterium]|nr:hypothetical protein [Clostridia bacterium]
MDYMGMTQEEVQKEIERMQRELEEQLAKMTPEERAAAEAKAQQAMREDDAALQKLMDDATKIAADVAHGVAAKPKFCGNCGAPAGTGNFCEFCGSPLS